MIATRRHRTSRETWSERARVRQRADGDEVDARLGVRADGLERDAARGLELGPAGDERDRARAASAGLMLSSRIRVDARGERLLDLVERLGLDLDGRPRRARAATAAAAIPPARRRWFSLTRIASSRPSAVVRCRRRSGRRTSRAPAGRAWSCACRGSSRRCPPRSSTKRRVSVAMPDSRPTRFSAVALAGEDRARGALDLGEHGRRLDHASPSATQRLDGAAASSAGRRPRRPAMPQTTPGSSSSSCARQRASGRYERRRSSESPAPTSSASAARDDASIVSSRSAPRSEPRLVRRAAVTCAPANAGSSVG